jgi:heat-inducible transcriptional repressor
MDRELSPATVRNIMADLVEKGYLRQTHPSSGRIPTDSGYRCYVDLLIRPKRIRSASLEGLSERLATGGYTPEEAFQETSKLLSTVSRKVGLVVGPRFPNDRIRSLQFVKISGRRAISVVVTDHGMVQNRMMELSADWSQEELNAMADIWNRQFASRPVREVQAELLDGMAADKEELDQVMEAAITLGRDALRTETEGESLYLEGTSNLLSWPEVATPDRIVSVMRAIEEKSRLLHVLEQSLQADGIQVYIGEEMPVPEMRDMSLVTAPYAKGGQVLGVLGVIGPTRMEYTEVISIVEYTADRLSRYLSME